MFIKLLYARNLDVREYLIKSSYFIPIRKNMEQNKKEFLFNMMSLAKNKNMKSF